MRANAMMQVLRELEGKLALPISDEDKLNLLSEARASSPRMSKAADAMLIRRQRLMAEGLSEAGQAIERLESLAEKLTSPPLLTATYVGRVATVQGTRCRVHRQGADQVVDLADGVDPAELQLGDRVILSQSGAVILGKDLLPGSGEIATFERRLDEARLLVQRRNESVVVLCSELLRDVSLEPGDLVRLSREALVALEAVARPGDEGLFLEDTPSDSFADIGGLDHIADYLRLYLDVIVSRPDLARKYDISVKGGICLSGPPGMGKTLLARAAANFLGQKFGACRFISVKPAAHHSSYYSETERNYRELFRKAREAASREPEVPVVMFFDELDAIGGMRGTSHMRVDDRVLHAIGAELDGLTSRGNILVLSATNRPDLLDGALTRPGRFVNKIIDVSRPKREGSRAILRKHLPSAVPFAAVANGHDLNGSREEAIEVLLTRIFSPNGSPDLAEIVFADGARRRVRPSDLVSGAILAEIARRARETALFREAEGRSEGVCGEDLLQHGDDCFRERAGLLTRANVAQYIDDVNDDGSVRGVEVREFLDPAPRPVLQAALSEVA